MYSLDVSMAISSGVDMEARSQPLAEQNERAEAKSRGVLNSMKCLFGTLGDAICCKYVGILYG